MYFLQQFHRFSFEAPSGMGTPRRRRKGRYYYRMPPLHFVFISRLLHDFSDDVKERCKMMPFSSALLVAMQLISLRRDIT